MRCQRPGCGKPIPDGRRKYCSDRCARIVNRDSAAARASRRTAAIAAKGGPSVRSRMCLACGKTFLSEGPWNRICPRCSERNVTLPPRATGSPCGASLRAGDIQRLLGD